MSLSSPSLKEIITGGPAFFFYPLTNKFIQKAYENFDLEVQKYCETARKMAEAISKLPVQPDFPLPASKVLDSSVRILAHFKLVDLLEQTEEKEDPSIRTYIAWVQNVAEECLDLLTTGLDLRQPLPQIYLKNPVRIKIDTRAGWSQAVDLPVSVEVEKIRQEIYKTPLKLVFNDEADVRGYLDPQSEKKFMEDGPLKNCFFNHEYVYDPETEIEIYPHESPYGKISSVFMEPREIVALKEEIIKAELEKKVQERLAIIDSVINEENIRQVLKDSSKQIVQETTGENYQNVVLSVTLKVKVKIQEIINTKKTICVEPDKAQIAQVQDHYPILAILKDTLEDSPITALRNLIYQEAKGDPSAKSPEIRYPRISYYAISRKGWNLLNAQYANEYFEGKNPLLRELARLLTIGINRFKEDLELEKAKNDRKVRLNKAT